jgi:hypothetical protein
MTALQLYDAQGFARDGGPLGDGGPGGTFFR